MFNLSKPPFDNIIARKAVAAAFDPRGVQPGPQRGPVQHGLRSVRSRRDLGFLEDAGMPKYDPDEAKKLVQQYEQETGQPLEFTITSATDSEVVKTVQFLAEELADQGGNEGHDQDRRAGLAHQHRPRR